MFGNNSGLSWAVVAFRFHFHRQKLPEVLDEMSTINVDVRSHGTRQMFHLRVPLSTTRLNVLGKG